MDEEKLKNVLNRSRRDRLTKAAKQGYGPWAEMHARSRSGAPPENAARSRGSSALAAVSEHAPRAPLLRQQRQATLRKGVEDEPDLNGFLAPKPPGRNQGPQAKPPPSQQALASSTKLELRISSRTNEAALAAHAGARPKAAARAIHVLGSDDPLQRPFEEMEATGQPPYEHQPYEHQQYEHQQYEHPDDDDAGYDAHMPEGMPPQMSQDEQDERDRRRAERKQKHKEEKRKREEWRKAWKEDKKRRDEEQSKLRREEEDGAEEEEEEDDESAKSPGELPENPRSRALTWSMLNNFGVTTARDAQRKYVGQVSDADLERRIREQQDDSTNGQKLMSEAEVLAKIQRSKGKALRGGQRH
eukprot:CAMPEP_0171081396 /NCGR_PEP_ID=MMETSP0766_2-20121228/16464_1 /TAXON_ID=439317 /ORGANISM="Gambierdiscus australes, Strain CAWD 149" /LENGTH=357 /DNA_ID=CAMNT_0011538695 /DNA_START=60 /DNA_END=1133 /DNA_ORIENTATION=+